MHVLLLRVSQIVILKQLGVTPNFLLIKVAVNPKRLKTIVLMSAKWSQIREQSWYDTAWYLKVMLDKPAKAVAISSYFKLCSGSGFEFMTPVLDGSLIFLIFFFSSLPGLTPSSSSSAWRTRLASTPSTTTTPRCPSSGTCRRYLSF